MTKLFGVIDGLLVGTRFLAWGIAMLGIAGSVVLMVANLPWGCRRPQSFWRRCWQRLGRTACAERAFEEQIFRQGTPFLWRLHIVGGCGGDVLCL